MAAPRVLLTGFGPFPGVPDNPSGWLAETLVRSLGASARQDVTLSHAVLPTEWEAMATHVPRLHEALRPHLMIHFGVSCSATGLRLERAAHNRTEPRLDAGGSLPPCSEVSKQGQARLETSLPVKAMAAQLRAQGHEARVSNSCGRYLCNDLYYRSLRWADAAGFDVLFVHVPLIRAQGGLFEEEALLRAGQTTVHLALQAMHLRAPRLSSASEAQSGNSETQSGMSA